jgi:hypothetical protein
MTCDELYQLMANPALLSDHTIPDLKQIVDDFPYFHAARMLYLKNLSVIEDVRQKVELKKMVIHLPDRTQLFILLEGERFIAPVEPQKTEMPETAISTQAADESVTVKEASSYQGVDSVATEKVVPVQETEPSKPVTEDATDEPLAFEPTSMATVDYTKMLAEDEAQIPATSNPQLQHQELIDSFILNEQTRLGSRRKMEPVEISRDSDDIMYEPDLAEHSPDNSYFTETLASIYIKQKRYEKALEIIKSLNLKYPEKSIYFADQIRYLEKLIIHTKK